MSTLPPPFDPSDDGDERYRRASGLDPSRPSEATRRAVLEHAARLAARRARRNARRRWLMALLAPKWRPATVGTVAVALLVAAVIAPQFLAPAPPLPLGTQHAPAAVPPQAVAEPANAPVTRRAPEEHAAAQGKAESASPARVAVARERARVVSSVAPAAPAPAPAASDTLTTQQLALRGGVKTSPQLEERAAYTAGNSDVAPARAAALQRSVAAPAAAASAPAPVDPEALWQAAAAGDLTALRAQLASGGDVDARDPQGRTALLLATLSGQADAVAVLLAHGADPSAADARGATPLQAAVAADERSIIALLRRYGAR